jgi:hypothetical protein
MTTENALRGSFIRAGYLVAVSRIDYRFAPARGNVTDEPDISQSKPKL